MSDTPKTSEMNLYQKLAAITGDVGALARDGRNTQQNYNFIEYAAVAGKLRDLFAKYGVIIVPRMAQQTKQKRELNGKAMSVLIDFTYTVINADKPDDKFTVTWTGEAIDYGDKATNKAATSALKYYLMRQFNISEKGDDPDAESPERGTVAPPAAKKATPPSLPQASEAQLTTIWETAKVKGKTKEWAESVLAKFTPGKPSKAAQSIIDQLNELEDTQEPPRARDDVKAAVQDVEAEINAKFDEIEANEKTQWDAHKVLKEMSEPEDDTPTSEQIERFKELRDQLGYQAGSTRGRLNLMKSAVEFTRAISAMEKELAENEANQEGKG